MTLRFSVVALAATLALAAAPHAQISLPITFEEDINYELRGFEGNTSQVVVDPTDDTNKVVETVRSTDAATFAGTVVADVSGFAQPIPFAEGATTMSVDVWSPTAGTPVRLKVENASDGTISVETEATTTQAEAWETLVFDFSNEAAGTAALDLARTYNKAIIFMNFGAAAPATATTYYWDNVAFGGEPPPRNEIALPITFEEDINYEITPFGNAVSMLAEDPTDASNTVVETTQPMADCFAGTTVAETSGFAEPLPFAAGMTTMTVRVWSPAAGIRVRLKVEEVGVPTVSVETDEFTTVANEWETLVFDFADEVPGTAQINFGSVYNKASIFFNFSCGIDPAPAPQAGPYYWDNMTFGEGSTAADDGPSGIALAASVFPNPTAGAATIALDLAAPSAVTVEVVDLLGRRVALLAEGEDAAAGTLRLSVPAGLLAPGTYLVRARTHLGTATTQLSVIR